VATKALGQAAANASQRPGKLGDAVKLEELILLALQGMERKANRSIEDMLARGFVNRLLLVAAMEAETGKGLKDILPGIVGIASADLPADKKKQMDLLTQRQEGACKEAGYIQDDLLGFFNRTRAERYGRVFKDMADKGTKEKLKGVADRIRANIAMEAIGETADWSKQFVAWAEMLKKKGAGGGGEGGEGQDPEAEDIEVMIGLMRARQREESLRDQTRLAEESRLTNEQYLADAEKLGAIQDEITGDVRALEGKGTSSELRRLVEVVSGEMMNAAVFLRRPQTDAATVAIETTIIELLSNDASAGDGSGGSGMAMKMLMGMGKKGGRGSGAGKRGGGSTAGGTTDKSNVATGAGGAGEAPEARNVDKAGGAVGAEWPEEFKEALEGYFKALEEEK